MLPIRLHRLPGGSRHFEADLARLFSRRNGFVFIGGLKPRDSPEGDLEQDVSDVLQQGNMKLNPSRPSIPPPSNALSIHTSWRTTTAAPSLARQATAVL